jgi:hypothetical protein
VQRQPAGVGGPDRRHRAPALVGVLCVGGGDLGVDRGHVEERDEPGAPGRRGVELRERGAQDRRVEGLRRAVPEGGGVRLGPGAHGAVGCTVRADLGQVGPVAGGAERGRRAGPELARAAQHEGPGHPGAVLGRRGVGRRRGLPDAGCGGGQREGPVGGGAVEPVAVPLGDQCVRRGPSGGETAGLVRAVRDRGAFGGEHRVERGGFCGGEGDQCPVYGAGERGPLVGGGPGVALGAGRGEPADRPGAVAGGRDAGGGVVPDEHRVAGGAGGGRRDDTGGGVEQRRRGQHPAGCEQGHGRSSRDDSGTTC